MFFHLLISTNTVICVFSFVEFYIDETTINHAQSYSDIFNVDDDVD